MKEIYKNPILYYIGIPVVVVLWPLFVAGIYLPNAEKKWDAEKDQYDKAQKVVAEILALDPERLAFVDLEKAATEFDYANAVEQIASQYKISPTNYKISSRPIAISGGQKSQNANVVLNQVDITTFAEFLSTIQLRWGKLQCVRVKLEKKKGLADVWDVNIEFKYYY